jgi:Carboxypeptidase regulatory-like domain
VHGYSAHCGASRLLCTEQCAGQLQMPQKCLQEPQPDKSHSHPIRNLNISWEVNVTTSSRLSKRNVGFRLFTLLLCFLTGAAAASAQGIITGGIMGTVVDQTGAVIPGAMVTAVNESTGTSLATVSNAEGVFFLPDVPLGSYTVNIKATGFGASQIAHVRVVAGNQTSIGKEALKLGSEAQTVQVEADAAQLINTESAQVETTIDSEQIQSAPVTGGLDNLTLMVPGVVNTHSDGMSNTNGANFSVNGQRGRSNNSEIDGQTNNDTSIGGPSFFFDN